MGPLISAARREKVSSYATGTVVYRGNELDGEGFWFPCTLVEATNGDRVAREEVFGPVAAVIPFEDEADAIRIANDTPYGLSGSIWTENGARRCALPGRWRPASSPSTRIHPCVRRRRSAGSSSRASAAS